MPIKFLNDVAVDTSVLYVDTINNRVGIGTTSPTQLLHVSGNARVTGAYYDSNNSAGTSGQVLSSTATGTDWVDGSAIPGVPGGSGTAGKIVMWQDSDTLTDSKITQTAGSETNYVDVDFANVEDLTITGDSGFSSFTVNGFDAVNFTGIENNFNVGSGDLAIATNDNSMNLGGGTADSDTLTVGYPTTRFIGSGNVGIGTTSPSGKLHVVGNTKIEGVVIVNSANSSLYIGSSTTGQSSTSTGDRNVVIGPSAFRSNTSAKYNTAVGHSAMQDTTTGDFNSVLGTQALRDNIDGGYNVAVGNQTMAFTTNSSNNTAVGYRALYQAQSDSNTGIGQGALNSLQSSTSSGDNTGIGQGVLNKITSGQRNVGVGNAAGQKYGGGNNNVVTANDSVFIGADSDAGGDNQTNQIVIGYNAIGLGSNTVVLGNNSIATTQLKGNVGIGTTSPQAQLHIGDSQNSDSGLRFTTINGGNNDAVNLHFLGTQPYSPFYISRKNTGGAEIQLQYDGDIILNGNNGDNVGIGTTLPQQQLHVAGASLFGGNIYFGTGTSNYINGNGGGFNVYANSNLKFAVKYGGHTEVYDDLEVDGDMLCEVVGKGLVLKSPNGTRYRIKVDNSGNLSTETY